MDIGNDKIGSYIKLEDEEVSHYVPSYASYEDVKRYRLVPCCVEGCDNPGIVTNLTIGTYDFAGSTLPLCDEHSLVVKLLRPFFTRLEANLQELYVKLDMLSRQHRSLADDVRTIEYAMYEEVEETV
jgi:hypothetical protein